MKNIFSWSVLVSIFTIFFYWFGYWYTQGYISYFGVSIEFYDLAIQHILIAGFLNSISETMSLIGALAFISFCSQFSRQQIAVFFHRLFFLLVYTIVYIITLLQKTVSPKFYVTYQNINSSQFFQYNLVIKFLWFLKKLCKYCINIFSFFTPKLIVLKEVHQEVIKKEPFQILNIEKKQLIKQIDTKSHKFDTQYSLHSFVLVIIISLLLITFERTVNINEKGRDIAEKRFKCSISLENNECSKYSTIKVNSQDWFLTNICVNSKCLIVNAGKDVKLIDITDKIITSNKS